MYTCVDGWVLIEGAFIFLCFAHPTLSIFPYFFSFLSFLPLSPSTSTQLKEVCPFDPYTRRWGLGLYRVLQATVDRPLQVAGGNEMYVLQDQPHAGE